MFTLCSPHSHLSPAALCWASAIIAALLETDWSKICRAPQVEKLVLLYDKTDVLGLPTFPRINLQDGQKMVVAWRRYGKISSSFRKYQTFCSTKNSEKKNLYLEYCNGEVEQLKVQEHLTGEN